MLALESIDGKLAGLHYHGEVGTLFLEELQVLRWVAVHHEDVGSGARGDHAELPNLILPILLKQKVCFGAL